MGEIDQTVQLRSTLGTWWPVITAGLLIAALAFGWWAYQINMEPQIEEDQVLVEEWSEETGYDHRAEIIRDSEPFELGEVVENRPMYYTNLSDVLDGTYWYEFDGEDGEVTATTETTLLVRAGQLEGQEVVETFWEVGEPLASTEETIGPDETHEVVYTVDIVEVLELIETVERQVGATEGLIDVRIRSTTDIEGEIEGETVSETHRSDKIMVVNPATFRVADVRGIDERHQRFQTVETVVDPSPVEAYGSILLFALAVVGLISMVIARTGGHLELTEEEETLLKLARDRERFSEWISTGSFPAEREYDHTVLVDDLEGLVDVAIDTNKRVIEDPQLGVSTVLDDNYIYLYVRPDSPARDWLIEYADTTLDEFDRDI